MRSFKALILIGLLAFAAVARCEDALEDEEELNVESDEPINADDMPEETEEALSKASPDADVACHLVQYSDGGLPADNFITVLVGFANGGEKEFTVDGIEASFRYPQDFNYHIQNFTHFRYNRIIPGKTEASFMYRFFIHESYHSRPMGLTVNVHYHDLEGKMFESAAFNETIKIHEPTEGFDAEAFFLYVLLFAMVALLGFGAYQMFYSYGRRMTSKHNPAYETGTSGDIDTEWLPKEFLQNFDKSPKKSPRKEANGTRRSPPSSDNESRQRRSQGAKLAQ